MRQMKEIGETEANLDEKEWSALPKFQISSENLTLAKAMIAAKILFLWHYNQQDRFVMKVSRY